jgi:hypothetical protein
MVSMVGCYKGANDPRVRVRTRARVFKYPSDHVDHVAHSVTSLSSISYTPTWSHTWSMHGGYSRQGDQFRQGVSLTRNNAVETTPVYSA